jgi:hypothetical protein
METDESLTSPVLRFVSEETLQLSKILSTTSEEGHISINSLVTIPSPTSPLVSVLHFHSHSLTLLQAGLKGDITVTIAVPVGFSFETLDLSLCANTGSIELGRFSTKSLSICSFGDSVVVSELTIGSSVVINAKRASVFLTFSGLYQGSFVVKTSEKTSLLNADACESTSESEGHCGESETILTVYSKEALVDFEHSTKRGKRAVTPTRTRTASRSKTLTPSSTRTRTPSRSRSRTVSHSKTPTRTATRTRTASVTRTRTASISKTRTRSKTPPVSPTRTRSPTPSRTPSITKSACPTGNPNAPTSAAVPSTWNLPSISLPIISGSKAVNCSGGSFVNKTTSTSFTGSMKSYYYDNLIVVQGPVTGYLIGDQPYRLTFTVQADPTNAWNITGTVSTVPTKVSAFIATNMTYDNRYITGWFNWLTNGGTCSNACKPVASAIVNTGPLGTTAKTFTVDFTSAGGKPIYNVSVAIRLDSVWPVNGRRNNTYTISNLTFTRIARSRSIGTTITVPSAFLKDLKEMPSLPSSSFTQYSNCPHNQVGLKQWQSAATWGGSIPPINGAAINIPANTKVLIDGCTFRGVTWASPLGTITIPAGSELIIGEGVNNLLITNIVVKGHLWIGSPTCRLKSKLNITISSTAADLGGVCGRRTICATEGGQIDIHGKVILLSILSYSLVQKKANFSFLLFDKLFDATWSRLASTAYAGDDRVQIQSAVNWEVGQQVVITATTYNNSADQHQFELRTIAAIEGKKIQFTEPLSFYHYAGADYQAEVGLLTRRIIIQGDSSTESSRIGGHVISAGVPSQLRLRGVMGYRMGQRNQMARYPFHFHMMQSSPAR